jgi:MFS family permease
VSGSALKRRHVAAVTLGNALEFYDFLTYAFFAVQIGHAFFPTSSSYGSLMLSLATFGAGFATRPIGAIVIGAYADRVGRKPAMLLCFVMIGSSILVMALIPSYATIGVAAPILAVIARMVQGFSLGGEIGSSTAYLAEAARPERRGAVVALQGVSQSVATLVASLIGVALTVILPTAQVDAYGWRIAFLIGGASLPFGLWLRASLPETLHTARVAEVAPAGSRLAIARQYARVMVLGFMVISGGTIASYILVYIKTYAETTLHMSERVGFVAEVGINVSLIIGALLGGWLSDRRGRRPVSRWSSLAQVALVIPVFMWIENTRSPVALVAGTAVLALLQALFVASFYAAFSESLPREIRSSGFGTVYSISVAVFGGTTQLVVTWLIHVTDSALAPAWYMLVAVAVVQVALFLFPESAPMVSRRT